MQHSPPDLNRRLSTLGRLFVAVSTIAIIGAAAWFAYSGIRQRAAADQEERKVAHRRSIPTVIAAPPTLAKNNSTIDLPGRLEPFVRADLYARVNGYVQSWTYDIGANVKAGDVLAEIDAPDLDQQLAQAESDLTNAKVNLQLADTTYKRYQGLTPGTSVSHQTIDEKQADLAAKQALVQSSEANVERVQALSRYKKILAPFDGMITARNTDVGQLISSGATAGVPMFIVSQTQKLRLYISVPQSYAPQVKVGMVARVTVPERPGKAYAARVEAMSGAIDAISGTSRYQLIVDNAAGELYSGAFANVTLNLESTVPIYTIPASALLFDKNGLTVATVGADNKAKLKPISVARDLGNVIEIREGLSAKDVVIDSPPDAISDGDEVNVKGIEKPENGASPREDGGAAGKRPS